MTDPDDRLPEGVAFVRSTPVFAAAEVPAGLLREHRVALGVWALLRVHEGTVRYVREDTGESVVLTAGEAHAIPPGRPHHVEPDADARLAVEFYR